MRSTAYDDAKVKGRCCGVNIGRHPKLLLRNIGRGRRTKPRKVIDTLRRITHVRIGYQRNRPAGVGKRLRKVQLQLCPRYWNADMCDWIDIGTCTFSTESKEAVLPAAQDEPIDIMSCYLRRKRSMENADHMDQIPCPDGYLLDAPSAIADGHHALNQYLVRVEEVEWKTALKEVNGIRDKRHKLLIWKALIERMLWLRDNNRQSACLSPFRGLAERIEKWTLAPTEADLVEILDRTAEVAGFLAPYTPMPHLFAYIDAKGLSAELAAAIRKFRERVYDDRLSVNQVSLQLFRSRLDMLAWRDEWTPIDLKRCWSEQIRADFRAMQGAERENWRRLLYSIHGDESTRPAPKWTTNAETAIQQIGPEVFRARLRGWLAPLKKRATQRLSREGSFVLRSFIWLAQASKDPELAARVAEISEVEFKPKGNGQKVIRAAAEAAGVPDPTVKPPAAAPRFEDLVVRALSAVLSPANTLVAPALAGRVEVGAEVVYVRGKLDTYEIHISGGAIFRQSDGRRVHIAGSVPQHMPIPFPGLGGMAELLRHVLILAEDDKNAATLTTTSEE